MYVRREKRSLNAISFDSAFGLIQGALDRGVNLQQVHLNLDLIPNRYSI